MSGDALTHVSLDDTCVGQGGAGAAKAEVSKSVRSARRRIVLGPARWIRRVRIGGNDRSFVDRSGRVQGSVELLCR